MKASSPYCCGADIRLEDQPDEGVLAQEQEQDWAQIRERLQWELQAATPPECVICCAPLCGKPAQVRCKSCCLGPGSFYCADCDMQRHDKAHVHERARFDDRDAYEPLRPTQFLQQDGTGYTLTGKPFCPPSEGCVILAGQPAAGISKGALCYASCVLTASLFAWPCMRRV